MSLDLIPEGELRAALRPYRVDAETFEAGVLERLEAAQREEADEPLAHLSPLLRSAATFLPLEVLAGCKGTAVAAKLAPVGGIYKLLGFLTFPAASLFVLFAATLFSVSKIRSIRNQQVPGLSDQMALQTAMQQWWWRHLGGFLALFGASLFLTIIGATWLLFGVYLVSFGLLLYVLTTLAKRGLGNRQVISQFCTQGLLFLGIASGGGGGSDQGIHFVNPWLIWVVFMAGVWILIFVNMASLPLASARVLAKSAGKRMAVRLAICMIPLIFLAFSLFIFGQSPLRQSVTSIFWSPTSDEAKRYVESFEEAPFSSASWHKWEIVAHWAVEANLNPDLSKPRRLLDKEIAGEQNPYILGSAMRVGLLPTDQLDQLKNYAMQRRRLLGAPPGPNPTGFLNLEQQDWVIRAAVLRNDLSSDERDDLEKRLHSVLEDLSEDEIDCLKTALRVTHLLEAIDRPIDRDQYRGQIHDWLRKLHSTKGGGFQPAGGFKQLLTLGSGSVEATAYAVELMEIYGVPDGLNLLWVRSYLQPSVMRVSDDKWITAATLERLDRFAPATRPTWLEVLYYERTLFAAVVLVGLCLYATFSSPPAKFESIEKPQTL